MIKRLIPNPLIASLCKWTIILFLINLFLIDPAVKGISRTLNAIFDKVIVKIVSLDLVSNPLTFCRLASLAIENKNLNNAELYLQYAEILESRYNYPIFLKKEISDLKKQIQLIKREHRNSYQAPKPN